MKNTNQKGGILKWVLTVIVVIILASYFFDFNVQEAVEDEQTQSNLAYIWEKVILFWDTYLQEPASYLWHDVFIDLLWETFIDQFNAMRAGETLEFFEEITSETKA